MKKLKPKRYDAHVLVCHGSKCSKQGATKLKADLQRDLKANGCAARVSRTTCQGLCKHGCVVGLEAKKALWWGRVDYEDIPKLSKKIIKQLR